jgi:SulP family sulfate permease
VVGEIKAGVPVPAVPGLSAKTWLDLAVPAASIALLVYASTVAIAVALATRRKEEVDPNQEFVGLAAASIGSGLLGGFPANASDSRSFVIADSGGRSQMVNVIGAGLVLITLIALTPMFESLPMAALGAVVIVSAIQLIDIKAFRRLYRIRRTDFVLALLTFLGVLALDVLPGIIFGVFVSLMAVLRRSMFPSTAILGSVGETHSYRDIGNYDEAESEPGLVVYRFDAPLFFANADLFKDQVRGAVENAKHPVRMVIIDAEGITDLDVTGAEMLGSLLDWLVDHDVRIAFARVRTSLRDTMRAQGFEERIGTDHFYFRVLDAVDAFHHEEP